MTEFFSFSYAFEILPRLLAAALLTVELTLVSFAIALVIALPLAVARLSHFRPLSVVSGSFIGLFGAPLC